MRRGSGGSYRGERHRVDAMVKTSHSRTVLEPLLFVQPAPFGRLS